MNFIRVYILSGVFLFSFCQEIVHAQKIFRSPIGSPIKLSANFGELRKGHFHSGIDIKTGGVTGKNIYAADDGYISRINVSPNGFGKALYITHPNGYMTVYAHLLYFTPEIDNYVKEQQYKKQSFQITLHPDKNKFPVKKGKIIAKSGNSGGSLGPHLHFEIRNVKNQLPVNPLLFKFRIKDNMNPVINRIYLYPLSKDSYIEFLNEKKAYKTKGDHGKYYIEPDSIITARGIIGVGIETLDYLNGSWNKCAVYSIEMKKNGKRVYHHEMKEFSFSETRYVNSHIDYEEKIRNGKNIHQTFIAPNNKLSIYNESLNRGRLILNDTSIHVISIIVEDVYKNQSNITFKVRASDSLLKQNNNKVVDFSEIMPYDRENSYSHNGFNITIPEGTLYDTLYFSYAKTPPLPDTYAPVHFVHNRYTPLHKYCQISITPDSFPAKLESKLLAARLNGDEEFIPEGGEWDGEKLNFSTRNFGKYVIVADTTKPEIKPVNSRNKQNLKGLSHISFRITDDLSGIESYTGTIDGKWALFEYDPKNELLVYHFDKERITKNQHHTFELKVTDNRDNTNTFTMEFYW